MTRHISLSKCRLGIWHLRFFLCLSFQTYGLNQPTIGIDAANRGPAEVARIVGDPEWTPCRHGGLDQTEYTASVGIGDAECKIYDRSVTRIA